jgi:hypothetical protein
MGILEQIDQASFLGEEFLTWLWYVSETRNEPFEIDGAGEVHVAMGQEMILGDEGGDAATIVLRGEMPSASTEARQALAEGKRVRRAKFYFTIDSIQWACTIVGASLAISGLRVPTGARADFDTQVIDRLDAIGRVNRALGWLFEHYLEQRLDPNRWQREHAAIVDWARGK